MGTLQVSGGYDKIISDQYELKKKKKEEEEQAKF